MRLDGAELAKTVEPVGALLLRTNHSAGRHSHKQPTAPFVTEGQINLICWLSPAQGLRPPEANQPCSPFHAKMSALHGEFDGKKRPLPGCGISW